MSTAQAAHIYWQTGHKSAFGPAPNQMYWSEVFRGNPHIMQPGEGGECFRLSNYPGHRPYILAITKDRIIFNPSYKAVPGFLDCPRKPSNYVILEPHIKGKISAQNKMWPWDRWQKLARKIAKIGGKPAQFDYGKKMLEDVHFIPSESFMDCLPHIRGCRHLITTDGGLHHAAAALGRMATVIWGGFSPPSVLGYHFHINLGGGWCGSKVDCDHCHMEMSKITVDEVLCGRVSRLIGVDDINDLEQTRSQIQSEMISV